MSRWRNNGGWNKRCGTVEKVVRIDSYEAGAEEGWGVLFGFCDGKMAAFDCDHYTVYGPYPDADSEVVEVWHKDGCSQTLELSRKVNGFGGTQPFFLCPACGGRVRYLYQVGTAFLCRKCAGLNYRSNQATRSDSMFYYHKGLALVEKHLDTWPRVKPDGFSFCRWLPERPRYMHQSVYRKYLARFLRYRKRHSDRQMEDMLEILGRPR